MSTPEMKYSGKNIIRINSALVGIAWVIRDSSMPRPKENNIPRKMVNIHSMGDLMDMSKPYQAKPKTRMAYAHAEMLNSTNTRAM
ncbi:hypothetical protein D3C72_1752020 [compost metagenome]